MPDRPQFSRSVLPELLGPILTVIAGLVVYTRFSRLNELTRDEGIYAYAGQRFSHGVAPYVSIWDPKTPGASMLVGASFGLARSIGVDGIRVTRLVFLATGLLTVLALYLLGRTMFGSVGAGLVTAAIFVSFRSFALEAAAGPDAKMPGVALLVLTMVLLVRRSWFAAGLAAGLAFLFWQPLLIYVAVAVLAAWLMDRDAPGRALVRSAAGALIPIAAIAIYFVVEGAFKVFLDAAFVQPYTGAQASRGLVKGIKHIVAILGDFLGFAQWLFWFGLAFVVVLAVVRLVEGGRAVLTSLRDPLVCVLLTLLAVAAFSIRDFQNYPDLDPLLPYAAVGFGGAYAALVRVLPDVATVRIGLVGVAVATVVGLTAFSAVQFTDSPEDNDLLTAQRAQGCALAELAGPGHVYALGSPVPLVLSNRVNPDHFVYLGGGVLEWKLSHLAGGFRTWEKQILAAHPQVVVSRGWNSPQQQRMGTFLAKHFERAYLGDWRVFVTPGVRARAARHAIVLSKSAIRPELFDKRSTGVGSRCA